MIGCSIPNSSVIRVRIPKLLRRLPNPVTVLPMKTSLFKRGRQDLKLAENSALRGIDMSGGGGAVLVAATLRIADSACPGLFRALTGVRRHMIDILECVDTRNDKMRDGGLERFRFLARKSVGLGTKR